MPLQSRKGRTTIRGSSRLRRGPHEVAEIPGMLKDVALGPVRLVKLLLPDPVDRLDVANPFEAGVGLRAHQNALDQQSRRRVHCKVCLR